MTHRLQLFMISAVLLLSGCNLQAEMLYYPSTTLPSQESLAADGIRFWPAGPEDYRGFVSTSPVAAKGTFVVFHGNAGTSSDRTYYVQTLTALGYRVILAEYPAYGGRKGEPGEAVFVDDAKETLRLVFEQFGKPVYLLGESLGCGVAAAVARDAPVPLESIILITPWDTLLSVAKEKFPWLPVRLFMKDRYDNVGNLKAFHGRIAVVGAGQDEIVPVRHALALYESLPGRKKIWVIKGAGHNNWPDFAGHSLWKELTDFVTGNEDRSAGAPLRASERAHEKGTPQ